MGMMPLASQLRTPQSKINSSADWSRRCIDEMRDGWKEWALLRLGPRLSTCGASYYKWNQWIFKNVRKGLAYKARLWTGARAVKRLANEEVIRGMLAVQKRRVAERSWAMVFENYRLQRNAFGRFAATDRLAVAFWLCRKTGSAKVLVVIYFKLKDSPGTIQSLRRDWIRFSALRISFSSGTSFGWKIDSRHILRKRNSDLLKAVNKQEFTYRWAAEKQYFCGRCAINPVNNEAIQFGLRIMS